MFIYFYMYRLIMVTICIFNLKEVKCTYLFIFRSDLQMIIFADTLNISSAQLYKLV